MCHREKQEKPVRNRAKIAGFVPETVVFLGVSPPIGGKGFRMAGVNMGVFEGETHVLVCLSIDE